MFRLSHSSGLVVLEAGRLIAPASWCLLAYAPARRKECKVGVQPLRRQCASRACRLGDVQV